MDGSDAAASVGSRRTEMSPSTPLRALIDSSHRIVPDDLPSLLVEHGKRLGALDVVLYLVDYEQRVLVPLPRSGGSERELQIDGTVAGRALRTITVQEVSTSGEGRRRWIPVVDGTERLGVVAMDFGAEPPAGLDDESESMAGLIALLVTTKPVRRPAGTGSAAATDVAGG